MSVPARGLSALLALAAAACLDLEEPELGTTAVPQIMLNQIMLNQIMLNGLTGTVENLQHLSTSPLADHTFGPDGPLSMALHDPDARVFMEYLVGCALSPDQEVSWQDPFSLAEHSWRGALGLCPAWATGAPSVDCQEVVSACLLARENAHGKSVAVSSRGARPTKAGPAALPLAAEVPPKATDIDGKPIASFEPCAEPAAGAERDCGWSASSSRLGLCSPGKAVTLHCQEQDGPLVLRVCDGIEGCDAGAPTNLAQALLCAPSSPTELEFVCGDSGAFAAMLGPDEVEGDDDDTWTGAVTSSAGAILPASEGELFQVAEGAWYGNLFAPRWRHPGITRAVRSNGDIVTKFDIASWGDVVYQDTHACYAPGWTAPKAYLHERLCALVTDDQNVVLELCLSSSVGPCSPAEGGACATDDGEPSFGDGDFAQCEDSHGVVRSWPLTGYLHDACDVVDHPKLCARRSHEPRPRHDLALR